MLCLPILLMSLCGQWKTLPGIGCLCRDTTIWLSCCMIAIVLKPQLPNFWGLFEVSKAWHKDVPQKCPSQNWQPFSLQPNHYNLQPIIHGDRLKQPFFPLGRVVRGIDWEILSSDEFCPFDVTTALSSSSKQHVYNWFINHRVYCTIDTQHSVIYKSVLIEFNWY